MWRRGIACLLALLFVSAPCAAAAAGANAPKNVVIPETAQTAVHISSRADWDMLALHCRLDTWSSDKLVLLDCDLDLPGAAPIPTFGGTFDGMGHTLSGFSPVLDADHQGLFRYVQEGAFIRNLSVRAPSSAGKSASQAVGGIVGVNSGVLEHCTFEGAISGGSGVGGIAGYNGKTGQILHCKNLGGSLTGGHSTGGIVGTNFGIISNCSNAALINTQEADITPEAGQVDWTRQLNSTENMPACTDTGGVAGYSAGILEYCSNTGTVGYPHTGYNVGGIVGRQMGQVISCSNSGLTQGRKEVGGIVGQMEPYTVLRYEEDLLVQLSRELDVLSQMIGETLDSTDISRDLLSGHITAITGYAGDAKSQASHLINEIESLGEDTVDKVNSLSSRVSTLLNQLEPIFKDMLAASGSTSDFLDDLEDAAGTAGKADTHFTSAINSFRSAMQNMDDALQTLTGSSSPPTNTAELLQWLIDMAENLSAARSKLSAAFTELQSAAQSLDKAKQFLTASGSQVRTALEDLSSGSDYVSHALRGLRDAVQEQNRLPDLKLSKLGPEFHEYEDQLGNSLQALNQEFEAMNRTAKQQGDILTAHLREINEQFTVINKVLRSQKDEDPHDRVVDISEEDLASDIPGKVRDCINTGTVEGDVNVGGLTGSTAIEYDFDLEDDIAEEGPPSFRLRFLTRVILQNCVNRGPVSARKNCVGGVVGRMVLGVASDCQSYGPVESTRGSYVGGIAGFSHGVIRKCWAKCSLTGSRLVGGVAGWATNLQDCSTLVKISGAGSLFGAVAGQIEEDGVLSHNIFVSESLGGIDGISYGEKAYSLPYDEFKELPELPLEFRSLTVTFLNGNSVISRLSVPYGGSVDNSQIPIIPQKAGYFGKWSDFERQNLYFDADVEAVYSPLLSAIASRDENFIAEGSFTPQTELIITNSPEPSPPCNPDLLCGSWKIRVNRSDGSFHAIRVALPEDCEKAEILILDTGGIWQKADVTQEGTYLRAEVSGPEAQICLIRVPERISARAVILAAAAVCAVLFFLFRRHKKKSRKKD